MVDVIRFFPDVKGVRWFSAFAFIKFVIVQFIVG